MIRGAVPAALAAALLFPAPLQAQDSLLAALRQQFQRPEFRVGALLQVVGDFQDQRQTGTSGFRIPNMRLRLSGELDRGFGYLLQTNFASSVTMLDAEVHYRAADALVLQAGQFKVPFSGEALTGAGDLDLVERSRVVTALAPARQLGVEARGRLAGGSAEYAAGLFNGNNTSRNDDNRLLAGARVLLRPAGASGGRDRIELAGNVSYSHDTDVALGPLSPSFAGRRTLWGADLRWTRDRWLLAAEYLGARLAADTGGVARPWGLVTTLGFQATPAVQLLLRWDALRSDGLAPDGDLLIPGLRIRATGAIQFRLNDLIDPDHAGFRHHRVLAGAQLGF